MDFLVADPARAGRVFTATRSALFRSLDGGRTWEQRSLGRRAAISALSALSGRSDHLLVGIDQGLLISRDGGDSFSALPGLQDRIDAIAVDPSNPDRIYAGSIIQNCYRSDDGGQTWTSIGAGLGGVGILALAVDPRNASTVYLGAITGAHKSTDRGLTWQSLPAAPQVNVRGFAFAGGQLFLATNQGALRSSDGGQSFQPKNNGLTGSSVVAIKVRPGNELIAAVNTLVYRSTNLGDDWNAVALGLPGRGIGAMDEQAGAILAGPSGYGIYRLDQGAFVASSQGLRAMSVNRLVQPDRTADRFYAGLFTAPLFCRGERSGQTWTATGTAGGLRSTVTAIAADRLSQGTLYIGGLGDGVQKSTDGGRTFAATSLASGVVRVVAQDLRYPQRLYALESSALRVSMDGGATWATQNLGASSLETMAQSASHPDTFYFGSMGDGIRRSDDGGQTTRAINTGLAGRYDRYVLDIAVDPLDADHALAATFNGPFITTDGGQTWTAVQGFPGARRFHFDPIRIGTVYAAGWGGVYRSTNGGADFSDFGAGLDGITAYDVFLDQANVLKLHAATAAGVYSRDL